MPGGAEMVVMKVDELRPSPYNPRKDLTPSDLEYRQIKRSIERWGLVENLVYNNRTGFLVGGHQRLKVLQELNIDEIPVAVVDLDENEEAALNVALNKLDGQWDMPKLAELLSKLDSEGYDATLTGFTVAEMEQIIIGPDTIQEQGFESEEWQSRFEVVVECENETDQENLFKNLTEQGYTCRVLTL